MRDITINSMVKTDSGNWEAEGSLEGNPFVARTIRYGKELIFKIVEGSDVAKSLAESDFGRGDRVSIAAACKAVRLALEDAGEDQLASPTKPGKRPASSGGQKAAAAPKPRKAKAEKVAAADASDSNEAADTSAEDDAERTRKEIEAIRALLAAAPPASDLDEMEAELNGDEDEDSDES